jgi:hypothetical protein
LLRKCVVKAATACGEINGRREVSRRESLVTMMQAADLREYDHSAAARRLDGARVRAVFSQR